MALKMPIRIAISGLIIASGFTSLLPREVQARGFFESLFGSSQYYEERRREEELRLMRERIPKVRVSSPRYYTYKPDARRNVSLAALARAAPVTSMPVPKPMAVGSAQAAVAVPAPIAPVGDAAFNAARIHLKSTRMQMPKAVGKALIAYYTENPAFLWVSHGRVNSKARSAMATFRRAESFGLIADDYRVALPVPLQQPPTPIAGAAEGMPQPDPVLLAQQSLLAWQKALVNFEMALSAKALIYVLDASRGRIDPNRLSGYHDLPRKKIDLNAVMRDIAASGRIREYFESRQPDSTMFKALRVTLSALLNADEVERVVIAPGTFLKPGQSNPELANVMAGINLRGSDVLKEKHMATLGAYAGEMLYTPELVKLVRDFQRENRLGADGIIGKRTIAALMGGDDSVSKIQKVRLAMERLRWLPRALGPRHVFINQPAFSASYISPGVAPLTMRVVVGKKSNQTNFFYDEIETVEFNPYWGVPRSIIINEMLPKLAADPSYLDRIGYEVTTARGKRISSAAVDWYGVANKSVPINVRQLPGRRNALGELKILFPNKHAIYMHDTPSKSLFKRDRRALSHGCVRLQDPRAMAAAVLGTTTDYIASRIAPGKNDKDILPQKIPVYISYFTAWPAFDGDVKFYNDVYGRDKHLARAMEITTIARDTRG